MSCIQQGITISVVSLLIATSSCRFFSTEPLIGEWTANDPTSSITLFDATGKENNIIENPVIISILFDKHKHGLRKWGTRAKLTQFTYRVIHPNLVEITYSGLKPSYYTFHQTRNTLSFDSYPESKMAEESIEVFCVLRFIRK